MIAGRACNWFQDQFDGAKLFTWLVSEYHLVGVGLVPAFSVTFGSVSRCESSRLQDLLTCIEGAIDGSRLYKREERGEIFAIGVV